MKLSKFIILAAAAMMAVACNNDPSTELELNADALAFEAEGGTMTFNVNTNEDWTIEKSAGADWLSFNPASGSKSATVTVTVQPYEDAVGRSATLTITAENHIKTLAIIQTRPVVPADPTEETVKVRAGAKEISVEAPAGYTYKVVVPEAAKDFVSVGTTGKENFTLKLAANTTGADREAVVTVCTTDDKALKTVTVKQGWRTVEPGDFLIEEVFFSGTLNASNSTAVGEQYIKLTNNSGETLYADGIIFGMESFFNCQQTAVGAYWAHPELTDGIVISDAFQIPGDGDDYPVEAGKSIVIALAAQNFSADNADAIDLSKADFEIYEENDRYPDVDNPDVPNMAPVYSRTSSLTSLHSRGYEEYAIFALPPTVTLEQFVDEYKYDVSIEFWMNGNPLTTSSLLSRVPTAHKIPNEWVLDGINCGVEENFHALEFNASVDAGYTGCGVKDNDNTRFGKSVLRKTADGKLVDTNNSTNDFTRDSTPTLKK